MLLSQSGGELVDSQGWIYVGDTDGIPTYANRGEASGDGGGLGRAALGLIPFYDAGAALFHGNYGAAAGYAAFDIATISFPPLRIGKAGRLLKPVGGEIAGYTRHGLNQVIGRDGGRGVAGDAILDAVRNPLKVRSGMDDLGRPFTRFDGARSGVVLNGDGKLVSAWGPARR